MPRCFRTVQIICVLVACVLFTGCEKPVSVSGTIRFAGEPISVGSIRFFPVKGTEGEGAATMINEGNYEIPVEQNMLAGTYIVSIFAEKETGRTLLSPDIIPVEDGGTGKREKYKETVQYIPQKYNLASRLEVILEEGENTKDLNLE